MPINGNVYGHLFLCLANNIRYDSGANKKQNLLINSSFRYDLFVDTIQISLQ